MVFKTTTCSTITLVQGRVVAAKEMISKLKKDRNVGPVVKDMETLCDAYIQLANWGVSHVKTETGNVTSIFISTTIEIRRIYWSQQMAVLTVCLLVKCCVSNSSQF